jgi:hypothetical protein
MRDDTIGKYGVGAKLAALNFGKRIDVWSRQMAGEPWLHVCFDLDDALEEERRGGIGTVGLDEPQPMNVPKQFEHLLPAGSGTLVLWDRADRLEHGRVIATFDELLVEVQKELARIYREYIDRGIKVEVNSKELLPHDPLFLLKGTWADDVLTKHQIRERKAKSIVENFPAMEIANEPIKVKGSTARLRITLYPPEVTRSRGMGGDRLVKALRVPENEGAISFMRMRREIAYTNVPRIFPRGVQEPDRFIGIEVAFDPDLDDYFGVRNVKRGVQPHGELRDKIRERLQKHLPTARKILEERWGKAATEDKIVAGEHGPIMNAVKDIEKTLPKGRAPQVSVEGSSLGANILFAGVRF